jgi:hypothetical protein
MNKFTDPTHPEWLALVRVLLDMQQQQESQSKLDISIFPGVSLATQAAFDALNKQDERDCLPGTRLEVLQDIKQWATEPDGPPLFWLKGSAGTGKSTIARTVSKFLHSQALLGASFFFSRDGGETLSRARLFFTTVANQLAQAGPAELRRHIRKAAEDHKDVLEKGRVFQWTNLILNPLKLVKNGGRNITRVMVVDALDECEDENDVRALIPLLSRVIEAKNIHVRLLVVSRPDPPIRDGFATMDQDLVRSLSLDEQNPKTVDDDIRLYLVDRFQTIQVRQGITQLIWPELRSVSRLVRLSAGLFIYAATACDFVQDDIDRNAQASLQWFLEEMERVERHPSVLLEDNDESTEHTSNLDRMYTRILQNALREGKDEKQKNRLAAYLRSLLGALVSLQEPLAAVPLERLREIKDEDVRWRLNRLHSVIWVPKNEESPLRLSHIAFRDFLLNPRRCVDNRFVVAPHLENGRLFENCLRVLETHLRQDLCDVKHPAASPGKLEALKLDEAFPKWLKYACKYWISHLILDDQSRMIGQAHSFLQRHLLHWLEAMGWIGQTQSSAQRIATLHRKYVQYQVSVVSNECVWV